MKTPYTPGQQVHHSHGEDLERQYSELSKKSRKQTIEVKKNLLLTPFLLSIPVISILFILISGSASEVPNTLTAEPLQREVVVLKKPVRMNDIFINTDSLLGSKTIALPARK